MFDIQKNQPRRKNIKKHNNRFYDTFDAMQIGDCFTVPFEIENHVYIYFTRWRKRDASRVSLAISREKQADGSYCFWLIEQESCQSDRQS